MPVDRNKNTGRFIALGQSAYEVFMEKHPVVKDWLINRVEGTRMQYGGLLLHFCEAMDISPKKFSEMGRLEARNAAWSYVKGFVGRSNSKARNTLAALKSFYRNKDGEILRFDASRGGKHYIPKRRKRASLERVPSKSEMYQIVDAANNIRDRAILLFIFQSGVRVNTLCNLRFKHVKNQVYPKNQDNPKIPLSLKITDEIDTKLKGYDLPFYHTFLQGEAVEALRAYCNKSHKDGVEDTPLFYSALGNPIGKHTAWEIVKRCVKRAGFNPDEVWTHTIRRVFRHVLRHSGLANDFQEALMGHRLPGSTENYFSRNRPEEIALEYMKVNFGRTVPNSRIESMEKELFDFRKEKTVDKELEKQEKEKLRNQIEFLTKKVIKLENKKERKILKFGKTTRTIPSEAKKIVQLDPELINQLVRREVEKRLKQISQEGK